jgi:hypothetical protein
MRPDPSKPVTVVQYESVYRVPFRATASNRFGGRSESLGGQYSDGAESQREYCESQA